MPLDFTAYLSERLGLSDSETNRLLANWLRQYEPLCCGANESPSRVSGPSVAAAPALEVELQQTA